MTGTNDTPEGPQPPQPPQTPNPVLQIRQNSLGWKERVRRTHKNIMHCELIKKMGIVATIKENFKIRERNEKRREKDIVFLLDPRNNRAASPQESEHSISSTDWEGLKTSKTLFEKVKEWLSAEKLVEIEKHHGEKGNDTTTANTTTKTKQTSINIKAPTFEEKDRVIGMREPPVFPEVLLQYANYHHKQAVPLPIFLNDNLRLLNHETTPPLKKAPTTDGGKDWVLDLELFCLRNKIPFRGKDLLTLDYCQWLEAIDNWVSFEEKRDPDGMEGKYTTFALRHCGFFEAQPDKVKLYALWKETELELRTKCFEESLKFDASDYEQCMRIIRVEYKWGEQRRVEDEERESKRRRIGDLPREPRAGTSGGSSSRFPAGNREEKRPSASPCCLACGARGHRANQHGSRDGPPVWAKLENGLLSHPRTGKGICVRYNIGGTRRFEKGCDKCPLEHICSFCGDPTHYAFLWKCRPKPAKRD